MNLAKASLRYPTVTVILAALLVIVGIRAFLVMPRTEDPTITIRTGLVLALYPGATSEQVEKQVTKTLEKHIFKFPEVRKGKTYSTSRPGLVAINVELEDYVKNADQFWAKLRNELNEARATELPDGVRGPMVNSDFGDTVAMLIAVHGKRYGYRELRDYVDRIQDELRSVRDIGKLATYGGQSEEILITSSLERVSQYFADPSRVVQALQQQNIIAGSGNFEAAHAKIPLRTTGFFTTEEQIRSTMVDVSKTGQPVYLRDFATVERRYQDPTFLVRHDGEPSILLSVEMQKGKNIVQLGEQIDRVFTRLKNALPPDVQLELIANQPAVVKSRMTSLSHEFLLAIGSVILVTVILLPIRVAVIAALAIPITLCATLGVMNALGIALHQVSIAALIVVLGIVVDDAIVIADNYVELLDRKVPKAEAAWRSATDVVVPVFTATVTIVFSFLPLLIISGSVGEFIMALPLTVAIALTVSFIVAVLFTPILCRFFIKKGLHDHENGETKGAKKTFSVLDALQAGYKILIARFMAKKRFAVLLGAGAFAAGVLLFGTVREQFFPSAERNQFVIDVWMSQGARIESTDAVMRRIESHLASRPGITHYASFVGQSAPRFYYNVNPQLPDAAYGQFIVNTKSVEATPLLVDELRTSLANLAPEALVIVKELQQGELLEAPIEVRISGDDIGELKRLAAQVQTIVSAVPYAQFVHNDFFNDSCLVDVNVNNELANRLGITNSSVSRLLSGALDGGPVNTLWEGDRPVSILLRLDQGSRTSFADVQNAYLTSRLTNASVPLRSIATLQPEWQTSRIVRRNGVRTITVRGFVKQGWYASDLLKTVRPHIKNLPLPPGYRIEYGGESSNSEQTLPEMTVALGISLLAIFLVLLVQFRTVSEPLVIMSSIPLALPGAVLGLLLTHNPFGFTAFMGMISLCGIVVRNAIILVDYIKEKIAEGESLEQAAREAGERRLRPIFLTTMAAAVGVTPMILSGSSLWSPLASVIAVGLILSMFFTLLVVPVLYVLVMSRRRGAAPPAMAVILAAAGLLAAGTGQAWAEQVKLTLHEAVDLARKQNAALKISQAKVRENRQRLVSARADYFPRLSNTTSYVGVSDQELVTVPAGSLGTIPGAGPFPSQTTTLRQGAAATLLSTTTLSQPLTQLFKVHEANKIADTDQKIAEADARKAEHEVILGVHQLYYGVLIAHKQQEAAQAAVAATREEVRESEDGVRAGNLLDVAAAGSRVQSLQSRHSLLAAEILITDLTAELNDLLGLAPDTELILATVAEAPPAPQPLSGYLRDALSRNPELLAARGSVIKAGHAVSAARDEYIPDISLFARHTYQDGVPFLVHNIGTFGVQMTWNILDWGSRRGVVGQRRAQMTQAEENVRRLEQRIAVDVAKAYRKLEQTRLMVDVAREALQLRKEQLRLSANRVKAGATTAARHAESVAAVAKAEADELQAELGYRLAQAELERIAGEAGH
ncbi:MMPL family transporter [Geobacter sp. FeAm09]|uniref:efflux RND transporter permease subunit n=1 Tax=Geobacter sp. FeAm09 TaxID=2597769 RepID=UPI0011ED3942|nr:efflux RND transporter permease subunit [Geobacter sp. FeAm09]QEM69925.1 MMPL family transporter [Geobacter sp. FeAm09]